MLFLLVFGLLVGEATNGTRNYDECKAAEFKPKACWEAKQLYKAGKWGCNLSNKSLVNRSDCV